ncbi:MAG: hypothetical protein GX162_02415 [Firmicutes bacterium]|nr:hypothetical protein [Bacillota bacterium]
MDARELELNTIRRLMKEAFPELLGFHVPIRARVVDVHEAGGPIEEGRRRYSVDVQPLLPNGSVDENAPVIPDVEIPSIWAGPNRGVFALPVPGAIVRVAWDYGDPAHPYVQAVLGYGFDAPAHPLGSFIIQHSPGCYITIEPDGVIKIVTPKLVRVESAERVEVDAPEVILAGGGPPVARVGDQVQVTIGSGSSAGTWTGEIVSGSEKVISG